VHHYAHTELAMWNTRSRLVHLPGHADGAKGTALRNLTYQVDGQPQGYTAPAS
jgi:hypothetical protein